MPYDYPPPTITSSGSPYYPEFVASDSSTKAQTKNKPVHGAPETLSSNSAQTKAEDLSKTPEKDNADSAASIASSSAASQSQIETSSVDRNTEDEKEETEALEEVKKMQAKEKEIASVDEMYYVVQAESIDELMQHVNALLDNGYFLYHGVQKLNSSYLQTVIRLPLMFASEMWRMFKTSTGLTISTEHDNETALANNSALLVLENLKVEKKQPGQGKADGDEHDEAEENEHEENAADSPSANASEGSPSPSPAASPLKETSERSPSPSPETDASAKASERSPSPLPETDASTKASQGSASASTSSSPGSISDPSVAP
jgi:hypothetical protein